MNLKQFRIFLIAFYLSSLIVFSALAESKPEVQIRLNGLVCSFCAQGLKRVLSKQTSLERFEVRLAKGEVSIWTKEGHPLPERSQIDAWAKQAGLEVRSLQIVQGDQIQ